MARGEIYAQVSCDYYDNDKMVDAGEKAELLYLRALCLSNRLLLDGRIRPSHLVALRFPGSDGLRRAEALVRAGLWRVLDDGWEIVGWHERNRMRHEIMAVREAEKERKRAERNAARAARAARLSGDCPAGQPGLSERTVSDGANVSEICPRPIDHRPTLNAQRASTIDHRSATDEVDLGDTSHVLPRTGFAPDARRNDEAQPLGASLAAYGIGGVA